MLRRSTRFCANVAPETLITVPINPTVPFKRYNAQFANSAFPAMPTEMQTTAGELLELYNNMVYSRRMETIVDKCYKERMFRGFCHLYIGQEAISYGMSKAMNFDDAVVTGYRDHVWHLCRGGTARDVFAEMMGKSIGPSKGKGGSMHFYNSKNLWFGGNGIVGAQASIGAGLAWKYSLTNGKQSPKNVAACLYGDGAANQGQIYECLNMTALWKVPCIFVCENNQFGMGTAISRSSSCPNVYDRYPSVPGLKLDGMNVFAVWAGTKFAKDWALAGNGPMVIEMDSYRYMGHSMSDPDSSYRTPEDKKKVRDARDCILQLKSVLLENNVTTEVEMKEQDKKFKKELDAQLKEAKAAPFNPDSEVASDIYASPNDCHVKSTQGTKYFVE